MPYDAARCRVFDLSHDWHDLCFDGEGNTAIRDRISASREESDMEDEVISLADYIHAIQVVLERVSRACPDGPVANARDQALLVLGRIESARIRRGISFVELAEFERIAGQPLPARVITWLVECNRRLFAREFDLLAGNVLALCRALEKTLRQHSCVTHFRPASRRRRFSEQETGSPSYRYPVSSRRLPVRRVRRRVTCLSSDGAQVALP